jgi:hypothetical protein
MDPFRLIFGAMLLSLCVFGLPEGCLVVASHAAHTPVTNTDAETAARPSAGSISEHTRGPILQDLPSSY